MQLHLHKLQILFTNNTIYCVLLFINDKIFLLMHHSSMNPRTGRSLSSTGSDFMFDTVVKRAHLEGA